MLTIERLGQLLVDNRPALPAAPAKEDGAAHFLHLEYQLLDRLMYKNGNSHQRTKYFGRLQQVRFSASTITTVFSTLTPGVTPGNSDTIAVEEN